MNSEMKEKIERLAAQYDLQIIYAFGSRAKEAMERVIQEQPEDASYEEIMREPPSSVWLNAV